MNKIHFIALMLFFSVPAAFGWDLVINNQTPFEAHLHIEYWGCKYDRRVIKPGDVVTVNAKNCLVHYIEGALVQGQGKKNLSLKRWTAYKKRGFSVALQRQGRTGNIYNIEPTYF